MISIIIPIFMIEEYLERCLESILQQTYQDFEVILVDDGSTDNSGKICDTYASKDKRFRVIHQVNSGVSATRNVGIENAIGDYVTFVDGDDFLEAEYLKKLVEMLETSDAQISIVGNMLYYETAKKDITGTIQLDNKSYSSEEAIKELLHIQLRQSVWGCLFRREIINNIRFPVNKAYAEDLAFIYQAFINAERIVTCKDELYHYSIREGSAMQKAFGMMHLSEVEIVESTMDRIVSIFPHLDEEVRARKIYSYFVIIRLIEYSKDNNTYKEIEKQMVKRIKENSKGLVRSKAVDFSLKIKLISLWIGGTTFFGFVQKSIDKLRSN